MRNFRGILFDFDGVLADTMEDHFRAWHSVLADFGIALTREEFLPHEGMPTREMAKIFCGLGDRPDALTLADQIVAQKDRHYVGHRKQLKFYSGVEELVESLHQRGVPLAIVSGGQFKRISVTVPSSFLEKFKAIITGEMTERGKPFPDPYLKGARMLGVDPEKCVVVENAPLGIRAAKAAGAYCIAIASTLGREQLAEADEVLEEFTELKDHPLIQSMI
ncbi:MAG: HAD family phosphatase [Candidatus Sungiibacteriota bacterium]|uniref:HAD family phosphatase n=1 Tax=Candidatus Sungiibacteriota bacterium TaxID=2750080 RepID=A0A7T5URE8_9BACT|nr:MAG: HAD family phosphatase [Candidatus Sungbacteria bacterium]